MAFGALNYEMRYSSFNLSPDGPRWKKLSELSSDDGLFSLVFTSAALNDTSTCSLCEKYINIYLFFFCQRSIVCGAKIGGRKKRKKDEGKKGSHTESEFCPGGGNNRTHQA